MKKIAVTGIGLVLALGLAVSGCGKSSSSPESHACDNKVCKTALKYAEADAKGDYKTTYDLEMKGHKTHKKEDAYNAIIPSDLKDKHIKKYVMKEYELIHGEEFAYRIGFISLKNKKKPEFINVVVKKNGDKMKVIQIFRSFDKNDVEGSEVHNYYSDNLSQADKDRLRFLPLED